MKLYYSEDELKNITEEESISLVSFEYYGEIYFYKDVQSIIVSEGTTIEPLEWKVFLNNDNFVTLRNKKELSDFKLKMSRFELLKIKINIDKIEDIVSEDIINKIKENITKESNDRNSIFNQTINNFNKKLNEMNEKYQLEINKLTNLKTEDFNKIIKELNEIKSELSEMVE